MRSAKLAKAMTTGHVQVRTGRNVVGQIFLKFRNPEVKDKIFSPYPLQDQLNHTSYTNLSIMYSMEQLKNSNLEDLVIDGDLELKVA